MNLSQDHIYMGKSNLIRLTIKNLMSFNATRINFCDLIEHLGNSHGLKDQTILNFKVN
jgi:hypothetical protein